MSSNDTKQLNCNLPPPQRPNNIKPNPHSFKPHKNRYISNSTNPESPSPDNAHPILTVSHRTRSIEEPVPMSPSNNNRIPIGLPHTPSPFHSNNNSQNQLPTVSEIHADDISHQTTLHPILIDSTSNTPQTHLSVSSSNSVNSPSYNSSSVSSNISLSNSYASAVYASKSQNNVNNHQMMMQTSANCANPTVSTSQNNNPNNNSNDGENNEPDNSGADGAGSGSSGGGKGGGDEKKENGAEVDEDGDEEQEEEEEEEEEEEKNEMNAKIVRFSELNSDADEFVPRRSRSASTLCCIHEQCVLMDASKSLPIESKAYGSNAGVFRYSPIGLDRARGVITIPKKLTQSMFPGMIAERIGNMYDFVDKATAIAICRGCYYDNGQIRIFNYGFHNESGEMLYCVVDKHKTNRKCNCEYLMRQQLFTKNEVCSVCHLSGNDLIVIKAVVDSHAIRGNYMQKIKDLLHSYPAEFCQQIVFTTKWHKLCVFNTKNNKTFNKQRHTFSITKTEFIAIIQKEIHNNDKTVQLVPIIMFNILSNGYRLEYVHIIQLKENISIGIAYIYDPENGVKVTGIHLNKNNILNQHQLASLHHDCHCLDGFKSEINDLRIGNPDDDINKYKDLKKKSDALKYEIVQLEQGKHREKLENQELQSEIARLKQQHGMDLDRLINTVRELQKQVLQKHNIIEYYRGLNHSINSSMALTTPTTNTNRSYSYSFSATSNTPQSMRLRGVSNVSSSSFSGLVSTLALPQLPVTPEHVAVYGNNNGFFNNMNNTQQ